MIKKKRKKKDNFYEKYNKNIIKNKYFRSTLPSDICENDFDAEQMKLIEAVKEALRDEAKTIDKCENETQTKIEDILEESSIDSTNISETYIASTCISEGIIEVTDGM